ncbi:maleylpyruvate isomerase family mycothiol-dependent enzyme [Micromonospora sp. NBC_01699]|uniref:maleylpyruvate isomerase family mycothiol-dependent enzyme n=1 Tax=Micromonospora sp. NBC_01699 TaxID=2975984 RepID=UPI002E28BFD2|nr:maleylpyruvate isomerase family mycothiol-dependent enzyme [Micromonospora sp. NBC_01699]
MTVDPLVLIAEVDRATERLLRTAGTLDQTTLAEPSRLPGWSRGHVLTHLARSADALVNLLTGARTGRNIPPYASVQARNADIDAGAGRPIAEQLDDLRAGAKRFAEAVAAMPVDAWAAVVRSHRGDRVAAVLVWTRLRELEVHHVDLAVGYEPVDWPEGFAQRLLNEAAGDLAGRDDVPPLVLEPTDAGRTLTVGPADAGPTVAGPAHLLAGWLIGRSTGAGLTVTPSGPLPTPPDWM